MPLVLSAAAPSTPAKPHTRERPHRKHGHYHQDEQSVSSRKRPGFLNLHIAQARDVQRQTQPIREQMRCQNRTQSQQRIFDRTKRRHACHATREQKTGQHSDHNRCKHALRAPLLPETSVHTLSRTRHTTLSSSEHLISLGTKRSPQKRAPFLI